MLYKYRHIINELKIVGLLGQRNILQNVAISVNIAYDTARVPKIDHIYWPVQSEVMGLPFQNPSNIVAYTQKLTVLLPVIVQVCISLLQTKQKTKNTYTWPM